MAAGSQVGVDVEEALSVVQKLGGLARAVKCFAEHLKILAPRFGIRRDAL